MRHFRGRRAAYAAAAVAALLAAAAALDACGGRSEARHPPVPAAAGGFAPGTPGSAAPALVALSDAAAASGITFRHVNGARGEKQMLETLGSGVCVFDADGDGRQDVYFVQSGALPGDPPKGVHGALYRNLGGGRFEDVTDAAGVGDEGHYDFGCVAGDVDGDGDRDLFVTGFGGSHLFRNEGGGRFTDDTRRAGVGGSGWATSATFFDADGDGDLDLYVAHYVVYDLKNNLYCGENRPGYRTVCHPKNFDSEPDRLYLNRGDGTFTDGTDRAGIDDRTGKGLGVVAGDLDDDGDDDLYVANDDTPNFLFVNDGRGHFTERGTLAGVALSEDGIPQAGMGTDMADADGDGRPDLFVTNLSEEMNELYRNEGNATFSNATFSSGLGPPSLLTLGFGTFFFDADDDGDLDLFVGNGHIIDNIGLYSDTVTFEQPQLLFANDGRGRFALARASGPLQGRFVVRGAVPFDYDDDGDVDILLSQNDRPALLWRNDGPRRGHWLTLTLAGMPPNRDAIGARVVVEAGARRQVRFARTGMSYASQGDRRLHVGLGDAAGPVSVRVRWPGGAGEERYTIQEIDRFITVEQGKGESVR
jgi:hypothetical protein